MRNLQKGDVLLQTKEFHDYVFKYVKMLCWRAFFEGRSWQLTNLSKFGAWVMLDDCTIYIPRDIAEGMKR